MRIVFDADGERVHLWLPGGHATLRGAEVEWHTAHAPFAAYAGTADEDVHVPGAVALDVPDVVEAVAIDATRAAVIHGRDALSLSIVDRRDARLLHTLELSVPSAVIDAFGTSDDEDDEDLDEPSDALSSERPRGARALARDGRLAIACAATGYVASFTLEPLALERAFRVATHEHDRLWAAPIAEGVLVAARFDGRWSEARVLAPDGRVLGAWPDPDAAGERWGMVAPVVLGRHVVVCTDTPAAYVLELPSLREVQRVELPGVARDAHGAGDRFGCVTTQAIVLARLSAAGRLTVEEVQTPFELMTRAGVRRVGAREVPGVVQRSFDRRLDDAFPTEPAVQVTTEQQLVDEGGRPVLAPPQADPSLGITPRRAFRLLDASDARAVISSSEATALLELSTGALTSIGEAAAVRARVLSAGVWLAHERATDPTDPFAQERVVRYVPAHGAARPLARTVVDHERWFHAGGRDRVVWSEPHEADDRTWLLRFVEGRGAAERFEVGVRLKNLALDGEALYAASGDHNAHIVRVFDDGTVTRVSEDVFAWVDALSDFVVADGIAYWITPYAHDTPQQLCAVELGHGGEPRVVFEASFGALTGLRVARSRLWWLESQTSHAELNGVNLLEPRAVVASIPLGGAPR